MAESSNIEWTDATWNPITGCTLVSEGCRHCYAARLTATRLKNHPSRRGLARINAAGEAKFTGEVRFNEQWLTQPLTWKRPRRIFVCAHGDLFHEAVPDEWIDKVFAIMALTPQHTYQVLTKRPERMRAYLSRPGASFAIGMRAFNRTEFQIAWPLPNLWLGTSVEDQKNADERIPHLLGTPAAVRFVSAEPLLGRMLLDHICLLPQRPGSLRAGIHIDALRGKYCESGMPYIGDWDVSGPCPSDWPALKLDWVIVGGESGDKARPMHPDWARSLRDQCTAAGVPFFFKQWGHWSPERPSSGFWRDFMPSAGTLALGPPMWPVGKGKAGSALDGREWKEWPEAAV